MLKRCAIYDANFDAVCLSNVAVQVLFSTGKKELGFETPSGDSDVSEPSTLGKIRRHFFLLIG